MAQKKYLSLERLAEYDTLLKAKMATDDASTLESAKEYADELVEGVNTAITSGDVVVKEAEHAVSADSAVKATQDANGNVIAETYETKTDAASKLEEAKEYADTKFDGHTHSWNDLEDKPFYEEAGSGAYYEWDGQWSSMTNVEQKMCKVSDATPTPEELIGARFVIKHYLNGVIDEIVVDNSHIMYDAEVGGVQIMNGEYPLAFVMYENNTMGMEKGIYLPIIKFRDVGEDPYVIEYVASLTIGTASSSIKQLDEKFIPDSIARTADVDAINEKVGNVNDLETNDKSNTVAAINEVHGKVDSMLGVVSTSGIITWDGARDGRESFGNNTFYKVADLMDGYENLKFTYLTSSYGDEINVSNIVPEHGDGYIEHGYYILVITSNTVTQSGYTFNAVPGIYFRWGNYTSPPVWPNYAEYTISSVAINEALINNTIARTSYVDNRFEELESYVGTIPSTSTATNVVAYVQEKTAGIATEGAMTELSDRITVVEGDVATIKGDYLKNADKTELQNNIDTVASAVELLTNGVDAETVDGVNDLIAYVNEHGTEVTGMKADIKANADAIAELSEVAYTGSWNDLADKPFGEEGEGATITWDGNTEGREILGGVANYGYAKVSDELLTIDNVIGGTVTAYEDGESYEFIITRDMINFEDENGFSVDDLIIVIHTPTENETTGVYFTYTTGEYTGHVSSLTYGSSSIKTLDSKFIGSDIARVADVDAFVANKANKATTLAGYGITDAYTSAETDTAIATAMAQFQECTQQDIENLFNT